uniref:Uncharacterized protein n=1 Tax=Oryza meridionalis TaxID=40149 RepID=A0A0E0DJS6_9ORYZ
MPLVGSWLDCIGGARAHGAPPKKPTQLRKPRLMAHSLLQLQEKPLGIGSVHTYVRWERVVCDVAPHLHHAQAKLRGACNWVLDFLKTQGNEDEQADNICGGGKLRDREAEKNARREREESG